MSDMQALHMEAILTNCADFYPSSVVLAKMFKSVRFVLSIIALDCGWKAVVRFLSNCSSLVRLVKTFASKLRPSSEWILSGQPKRLIQWSMRALAVVRADWSGCQIASCHLVKWSPIRRMYWFPAEGGRGPNKSTPTVENGKPGFHARRLWISLFEGLLRFWQTKQLATNTSTSRL